MALRTVGVRLVAEISGYQNKLRAAAVQTKEFASGLDQAAKAGKLDKVADAAGKAGLGLVALAGGAVFMAARFDKAMSAVDAATHASAGELNQLRQAALKAGKDTAFSATEAAKGIEELAKAGVSTRDVLSGGLRGALDLAAAGSIGVGEAAETAASAMTQFKLSGKDLPHVADLLAAGAGKAQGSVSDMSMALKQGGLVAAQMGLSIEEATGTLAAFASAGLLGSDAGTSLKTMLLRLAAPTDVAKQKMDELGISAFDSSGQFVGMSKFAANLQQALAGLTDEQRNAALSIIFGADAIRSASIVYQQGQAGIQGWIDKTNDSGFAADTAARKTDNLVGDIERLRGSLETLAIQSGSGANVGLRNLAQGAEKLVNAFGALPGPIQTGTVMMAGIGGAALLAVAALIKMRRATAEALAELRAMGPAGTAAATGLERASRAAKITAAAFIALEVVDTIISELRDSSVDVDKLTSSLEELGKTGKRSGELARIFGEDSDDFKAKGQQFRMAADGWIQDTGRITEKIPVIGSFGRAWNQAFGQPTFLQAQENVRALDMQLAEFAATTDDVSVAQSAYTRLLQSSGLSAEEFAKIMPKSNEALRQAWQEADKAGTATDKAGDAMSTAGKQAEDAAKQVQDLKEAFDDLFGIQMSLDEATIAYSQGIADVAEAFKGATDQIVENNKKGKEYNQIARDQRSLILDQIGAINDLRTAEIDNGASVDDANTAYDKRLVALGKQLIAAGANEEAVWDLINAYRNVPKKAETAVSAPGVVLATTQVGILNFTVRKLPDGRTVTIASRTKEAEAAIRRVQQGLGKINSKNIHIGVYYDTHGNLKLPGGRQVKERWGGITEHAQSGLLREAATFSARFPARYAFAEPATGGEAFIPKYGDRDRSRDIWSYVGKHWLGMNPMSAMVRPVVNVTVTPVAAGGDRLTAELMRRIRYTVRVDGGGNVQKALGQ